jgi:general secretion pathway protein D
VVDNRAIALKEIEVKGSKVIIVMLVVAVAAALVWKFVYLPRTEAKKPVAKAPTPAAQPGSADQQALDAARRTAEDPNQSGRGFGRSRRNRTADSGDTGAPETDPNARAAGGGMDTGMGGGMDMGMGMGMGMGMPGGMDMGMGGGFGRSRRGGQNGGSDSTTPIDVNDTNALEALNLQNVPMTSIIDKVSKWTGKVVIPTNDSVMQQRVTIYAPARIRRVEALGLIFAALRAKGVAVEQSGNVIFLKPVPDTTRLSQVPVLAADTPLASLTDKNQMVQKSFVVRNYDVSRLSVLVTPLISTYGYVSVDENTGSITMIDTVDNLMRLEKMINKLDKAKVKGTEERIFQLTTGDATAISELVEKLMNTSSALVAERMEPNMPAGATGVTSVVLEQKSDMVTLVPEAKNNWIIARATPGDMNSVSAWIGKLDKEMQVSPDYDILQVKYVDVTDLTDKVTKTLQNMPGTGLKASVLLQPLPKSRQIMLFGSKEKRDMVKSLVAEIDTPGQTIFEEKSFLLRNADPDAIKKNIDDLYGSSSSSTSSRGGGGFGGGGFFSRMAASETDSADTVKVISYPSLGQVTVIASPANMAKITRQIEEWDVPVAVDKMKPLIIELTNSDPVKMADLLSKLFSQDQGNSASSGARNFLVAYLGASQSTDKQNIIGPLYGQLSFEAVPDTKKIIVISKIPAAYTVVEMLIRDLDKKEVGETPSVITLKYADPEDLCQRLNAMFNQAGTSASIPLSKSGLSDYSVNANTGTVTSSASSSTSSSGSSGGSTGSYTPWWTRASTSTTEAPISNIIGKIRFIPDTRSKSIMVLSPKEYLEDITSMIQKLDMPAKQVMVQAVIIEVAKSDLAALGAEYSTDPTAFGQIGVNGATALTQITSRSNPDATNATTPGTFNMTTNMNITALVDLLVTKANAKILNQPTLWTRDNEEATFFKGKSVPFTVSTQTDTTNTSTKDSVEYRGVGVTLRVRPNITPEKAVDMTVNLSVSQLDAQLLNGNPVTSLLDTTTKTIVPDGQTIMMGGIIFQTDTETINKVPLLGDIPLIGWAFTHVNSQKATAELIVFITPYVIDTAMSPDTKAMEKQGHALDRLDTVRKELRGTVGLDANDVPLN